MSTTTDDEGDALRMLRQRVQPVEARHRQVEQHEIGLQLARERDRVLPARGLPADIEPVVVEQPGERLARERMVVDDQDAHGGHRSGRFCRYRRRCTTTAS